MRRLLSQLASRLLLAGALAGAVSGCGDDGEGGGQQPPLPPYVPPPIVCDDDTVPIDGGCFRPGVPDGECGAGFVNEARGSCAPVLPGRCNPGELALPGESSCREVAPCGDARFGEAGGVAGALFVDGSVSATGSGTEQAPFATIGEAIAVASDGDVIAVAAGSYQEDLIVDAAIEIVGRCPSMVEVVGDIAAVQIKQGASGARIARVALTGSGLGAVMSGAKGVRLEQLWIHDTAARGVDIEDPLGATEVTLADSLIERTSEYGLYIVGATVDVARSVVRDNTASSDLAAAGVVVFAGETGASTVAIEDTIVEGHEHTGLYAESSTITLRRSVVTNTISVPDTGFIQGGVEIRGTPADPGSIEIAQSVIKADAYAGLLLFGATATLHAVSVVDGRPDPFTGLDGRGIELEPNEGAVSSLEMTSSAIVAPVSSGIVVGGGMAYIDASVIRGALLDAKGPQAIGVNLQPAEDITAKVEIFRSLVTECEGVGIGGAGELLLERSRVSRTLPIVDGTFGRGVEIHFDQATGAASSAVLRDVLVDDNRDIGLLVVGANAEITRVTVRGTKQRSDGRFGDGIGLVSPPRDPELAFTTLVESSATVDACSFEDNDRAGVLNVSGWMSVKNTSIRCNAIDLDGESHAEVAFEFVDEGGNACGCNEAEATCRVQTSQLEVPQL